MPAHYCARANTPMAVPDDAKLDLIARLQQLPMRHRWLRWAVLAGSLSFSTASTYYFSIQVRQEAHSRFGTVALGVANDVQSRVRAYGDVLYAIRGLFDSSTEVTRDEFHQFAQALSLGERYPGATNISFAPRVLHAKKLEFERAVRAERSALVKGLPRFAIKPPGERPEYVVLTYIEPMGKNVAAWGLDLNADPLRRSVVDRARDSGQISSSSGITLVRDGNASVASTLLRLAVYRGGGVPGSVEERQRLYWGMVGSTLRIGEMIDATLSKAMHDQLTGLYNRHYVEEWFGLELRRAQRHGRPIAAIMLDVDHFKGFNDTFGHQAGDLVLRELAGVLRRFARKSDIACRYGGEEFLVLLPECPFDDALRKAEQLREEAAKLNLEDNNRALGSVTVSIGVAAFPHHAQEAEALLRCADEALYDAKAAGRDRVVGYSRKRQGARERV